ncbi:EAL and HDOD domain-containing protein [Azospira restricta]|uniref:HDOD domain-containing protein n=1 Tax=Azospira restricta TaxID=404405 RepID=A0A974PVT9_9RHOO|nr:HDOD domain-containing protein [Azospira restricta]QRJ62196.1 HDOD domain-containing protein [Azospira restricta]
MGVLSQRIVLRLLADAGLRPAALQLIPLAAAEDELAAGFSRPALAELAAAFPCVIAAGDDARLPPAIRDAARAAGCRIVDDGAILVPDAPPAAPLPGGVRYLAGDALLQLPARSVADKTGSRTLALRLAQLVASDAETREIEEVFRLEPTLSYHLLRLVNSPGVGAGRQITSFAQAILILGRNQLRRWLNLLLFAARKDDPRAPMLMARASARARSLELLAKAAGYDRDGQERAFMAGMFSLLGVMFGMPLADVLQPLRLDESVVAALLRREGELGDLMAAVEAGERGDLDRLAGRLADAVAADVDVDGIFLDAHRWTLGLIREAGESGHG